MKNKCLLFFVALLPFGAFGSLGYRATTTLWDSWDIHAADYAMWSPWMYCGGNPIRNTDPTGNVVNMKPLYSYDKMQKQSTVQSVIKDLVAQTGLQLSLDSNHLLQYAKDDNGNPIVNTTTDKQGNVIPSGSETARKLITEAIDNIEETSIYYDKSSYNTGKDIALNPEQIQDMINGAVGIDGKTLGYGMTFMHEVLHSPVGGGLSDSPNEFGTGPVVDFMNRIRRELNEQGYNYGERMNYIGISTAEGIIIPFNRTALNRLRVARAMGEGSSYIKIATQNQ